jgi:hypothetical protein
MKHTLRNSSLGCIIKSLPTRLLVDAAKTATRINPTNAPVFGPLAAVGGGFQVTDPLRIAVLTSKYWGPTPRQLTVSFMEATPADLSARILTHMNAWTRTGCISFVQTNGTGDVRISREPGGYWSYLGTDILHIPKDRQTMNLEGFTMDTSESEYRRVVRHQSGHTLGFPHEHLRHALINRIDFVKAYQWFLDTYGWDKATVEAQVLTALDEASLMGTPADQDSIMCYQLPGLITTDGLPIDGGTDIDPADYAFCGKIYPQPRRPGTPEHGEGWDGLQASDQSEGYGHRSVHDEPPLARPADVPDALPPIPLETRPGGERRISAWVTEGAGSDSDRLCIGESYVLSLKVGSLVERSLITGPTSVVPASDVPEAGLDTTWVVSAMGVELAATPCSVPMTVDRDRTAARHLVTFGLKIPPRGESETARLLVTPRSIADSQINVIIYVGREIYREFVIRLEVMEDGPRDKADPLQLLAIEGDRCHSPAAHLNLRTTHEWTTPPGQLTVAVVSPGLAYVMGESGGRPAEGPAAWSGIPANVAGPIENIRTSAERFRTRWEDYLNDIDPEDLAARLLQFTPQADWDNLTAFSDSDHQQVWEEVRASPELRNLAVDGYALYESFFPRAAPPLREWIDGLLPGQRLNISWLPTSGVWVPNIPWGLLYRFPPPSPGQPVDPMGFLGLQLRLSHYAYPVQTLSKALGSLKATYRAHCLYWGQQQGDVTGQEARWQAQQWSDMPNQVFVPAVDALAEPKTQLLSVLDTPQPSPVSLLYLFCQCSVGAGNDPVLRFGSSLQPVDNVKRTELSRAALADQPLVFANACSTVSADPYFANELEKTFFSRGCRGYLGTETKVPIQFASRFAAVFFHFFYRKVDQRPMAAGEGVAQSRQFLWTHYRNLGGLLYTYVNQYDLFMADGDEVTALRT